MQEQYRQMREVANAQEWERLVAMEQEAAALLQRIEAAPPVPAEEVAPAREQIEATLALGREIEAIARPHLENLRELLRDSRQGLDVRRAYSAV
ncbi:MAG: flagellar protein FliT [Rhodocyclaceae bacterium]|nr:flagellar protein FliT [Rhodocyclaceae bacterium]